jgi:hypothetical protein
MANTSLSECDRAGRKHHMNMKHLLATSICAGFVFIGLHTEERVNVEGLSVRIVRAPNDGLNDLAVSEVWAVGCPRRLRYLGYQGKLLPGRMRSQKGDQLVQGG